MDGQNGGLPAGVQQRQAWRPVGVRAVESLLSGMVRRHAPFVEHAERLTAWFEQFTQRVQPWSWSSSRGWSPLSMELRGGEAMPEGQTEVSSDGDKTPARGYAAEEIPNPKSQIPNPMTPARGVGRMASAATAAENLQSATSSRPAVVSRPALRLAVLRQTHTAAEAASHGRPQDAHKGLGYLPSRSDGGRQPLLGMSEAEAERSPLRRPQGARLLALREHSLWRPLLIANEPTLEPRLVVSVSASPRREVRGGFPVSQPPMEGSGLSTDSGSGLNGLADGERDSNPLNPLPKSADIPHPVAAQPGVQSAIERLIEQTVLPVALPGLELRLVSPEQQESASRRPSGAADDDEKSRQRGITAPTTPNPLNPPKSQTAKSVDTPPLDINAIADKVYQTLMRRQQVERERRGLY